MAATILNDRFAGVETVLPDHARPKLYPDPKTWAFTFWPGIVYPDSYGDGTNWLEGNAESQAYLSPFLTHIGSETIPADLRYDPFTIQSDGLHIRAAVISAPQQAAYHIGGHRRFGSGILLSRASFTYGTIRIVAKLPAARGAWPALWFLPAEHKWPPEIDLLEAMPWGPHRNQAHVGFVLTPGTGMGEWKQLPFSPADGFHEYRLTWTPEKLAFYADGALLAERPTPPALNVPMYLVINFAVGGKWVYNELGIPGIDSIAPARLEQGAASIAADYPTDMVIRSVTIDSPDP